MAQDKVFIIGGAQTDFAEHWGKQGKEIADVMQGSFDKALIQSKIDPTEIQSIHIGNFVGELFCGQGQLGGLLVELYPALAGVPSARHEAACASGSMAIMAAMREIEAQHYDLIAVTGVEMMRHVGGQAASEYLGAAAWVGHEAKEALYPWVHLFSDIKNFYAEQYGIQDEHLAEIAKINYSNAKRNKNGQARNWNFPSEFYTNDDLVNPIVEGNLRKSDCGRITDGSATIFLASEKYAKTYAQRNSISIDSIPFIKGWGHRSAPITLHKKLESASDQDYPFPHLKGAIDDALNRASVGKADELDLIETHDCFTISEYVAIEHFGLAAPGEAWKTIENNAIAFDGTTPINPSGGIIGSGHPVGATGVRMMLDAYKQVSGQAEDYQVENTQNVGILNIGGSFTTVASFVVGK